MKLSELRRAYQSALQELTNVNAQVDINAQTYKNKLFKLCEQIAELEKQQLINYVKYISTMRKLQKAEVFTAEETAVKIAQIYQKFEKDELVDILPKEGYND